VAAWTWPTWVVSRRRVLEAVFVLLEYPSPSRRIFISSHSLLPLWFAVSVLHNEQMNLRGLRQSKGAKPAAPGHVWPHITSLSRTVADRSWPESATPGQGSARLHQQLRPHLLVRPHLPYVMSSVHNTNNTTNTPWMDEVHR
jgi:hypothetical protein